MYVGVAI